MKVNNTNASGIASQLNDIKSKTSKGTSTDAANANKSPNAAEVSSSADLNISSRAKARAEDFLKIKDIAMNAPDVDEAKVAKFRDLIDNGKYSVDAEAVSDRLVDDHAVDAILGTQN